MRKALLWLSLAVIVFAASGATCNRNRRNVDPLTPAAFLAAPTLEDVIYAVNANANRVQSLQVESASLSAPGYPSLRASLAMQRPRRFRLRGSFLGPELDVGSNDELLWVWAKGSPEPAIYFARHDQFQGSRAQQLIPVEPAWIMEAFGLVQLEPGGAYEGPLPRSDGTVEIRSRTGQAGQFVRSLVIDDKYGWVVEQQVMDSAGQLIAGAKASNHRFYPTAGVSLPHHIDVRFPPAQLTFSIDVGQYSINQLVGDPAQLWSLPQLDGYTPVNLAEAVSAPDAALYGATMPGSHSLPYERAQVSYRPRYRGYSAAR